jgi:hypothetical protein
MPGPVLTVGAAATCAHGGKVTFAPNPKVTMSGQPIAMWMPVVPVVGCALPPPPVATGPDVTIALLPPSFTVKVTCMGMPMMIQTMAGMGNSGFPMLPVISAGQVKVIAT